MKLCKLSPFTGSDFGRLFSGIVHAKTFCCNLFEVKSYIDLTINQQLLDDNAESFWLFLKNITHGICRMVI